MISCGFSSPPVSCEISNVGSAATYSGSVLRLGLNLLYGFALHVHKLRLSFALDGDERVAGVSYRDMQDNSPANSDLNVTIATSELQRYAELLAFRRLADDQLPDDVCQLGQTISSGRDLPSVLLVVSLQNVLLSAANKLRSTHIPVGLRVEWLPRAADKVGVNSDARSKKILRIS